MTTTTPCTCGIPNRANFHIGVVLGRDIDGGTETSSADLYVCADHVTDDVRSLLAFDHAEQWDILEARTTGLRYRLAPSDVLGYREPDGDVWCLRHAAANATRDAEPLRRDALEVNDWPTCADCAEPLLSGQTPDAVADVVAAVRSLGLEAAEVGTGGGSMAVRVVIDAERVALITDGDAYVPQGGTLVLGGHVIDSDGEQVWDGRDVVTLPHDVPRLVREVRAYFGMEA